MPGNMHAAMVGSRDLAQTWRLVLLVEVAHFYANSRPKATAGAMWIHTSTGYLLFLDVSATNADCQFVLMSSRRLHPSCRQGFVSSSIVDVFGSCVEAQAPVAIRHSPFIEMCCKRKAQWACGRSKDPALPSLFI